MMYIMIASYLSMGASPLYRETYKLESFTILESEIERIVNDGWTIEAILYVEDE